MTLRFLLTLLVLFSMARPAIAEPPPTTDSLQPRWVRDPANVLSLEARTRLETLLTQVESETSAEVMVFTLADLGGYDIDPIATQMFNHIGIGKANVNNGILFLIAPKDRRTRIEVGYGLEPLFTDALAGEILDTQVIPRFKEGDMAGGIIAGTEEIARVLRRYPEAARGVAGSTPWYVRTAQGDFTNSLWLAGGVSVLMLGTSWFARRKRHFPATLMFIVIGLAVISVGLSFYAFAVIGNLDTLPAFPTSIAAIGLFAATWMSRRQFRRYGPHKCEKCGGPMHLLSEQEDDKRLSKTQQIEEQLGSVDYDVWECPACMHHGVEAHTALATEYGECPECHALTLKEDVTTLVEATTSHGGSERIDAHCLACNHRFKTTRDTPRLSESSSSSGGSSGGGSSGGGSSGGGGASRSW
jgi:uncharacterized protein